MPGIIDTVAKTAKLARRTRKRSTKELKRSARELRHQSTLHNRTKKVWLLRGLLATATVVGTIVIVRTLSNRLYPEVLEVIDSTRSPVEDPVKTPAQKDPDADTV
ncbi:hypothetical protein NHF46_12910 [Arthrobacter alpinus]|nr:hypothetical protein [Arthrobacter alpinus]